MKGRFRHLDWGMLAALGIMALASLLSLASVAPAYFVRQLSWYVGFFIVVFVASQFDWRRLGARAWFRYGFYGFAVLLLVATNLLFSSIHGAKSWITIGGFQFEPVELTKVALIIIFAHFFSRRYVEAWYGKNILVSFFLMALPTVLVVIQPDLGSSLILIALWIAFLFMGSIHVKRLLMGMCIAIAAAVLAWCFVLKPYQQDRITSFLFPERDPLGVSYNVIQSKVAIGSGGIFGKGFGGGTQARLHFLPAAHNDFLFASFIEEWGAAGGALLLFAFTFFLFRISAVGLRAKDNYSRFLALGGGVLFAVQAFINVGANLGFLPVTGLTFPFFSYGGSSLLTAALLVGIIQHIKVESR